MIVLDASAVVEFVLGTSAGRSVADRLDDTGGAVHAPYLLDIEVIQTLRRYDRERVVEARRITSALLILGDLTIHRHEHGALLPRIWELRNNVTAYDAAYVALAEALDFPLLTRDRRLAKAKGIRAAVEVI